MKKISVPLLLSLIINLIFLSVKTYAQPIDTAKLDSFLNVLSAHNKVMGSFLIAKNGKPVYRRTVGHSQLIEGKAMPATFKTQYRIGSITKTFTATMIFQLIDENKLSLTTRLSDFFPDMPNASSITIAHLLNHTSGLVDYVNENLIWITDPHSKPELLEKIATAKPYFDPGTKQQYSNGGYLLLGYIIEKITGKAYAMALKERILDKLGLKNTIAATINNSQRMEAGSYRYIQEWTPVKDIYFPNVTAVGDILSTPQDLITFIDALFAGKLTSMGSLNQMKHFEGNNQLGMGLLWVPFYDKKLLGHNGGTFGTYSVVYTMPEDGMSFAFCLNGLNYKMNDITLAMLCSYYNSPFQVLVLKSFPLKTEDLDGLLGNYSSLENPLKISITKSGTVLLAQATGQSSFPLDAVSRDEFKHDGAGVVLRFNREKQEMTLIQGGKEFRYTIAK